MVGYFESNIEIFCYPNFLLGLSILLSLQQNADRDIEALGLY
ncbi:hypothetical protein JOD02_000525 [Caldicoprobacter guelmensis]|nr:hypothetical protein [Caldicoprobacter guelmensis]